MANYEDVKVKLTSNQFKKLKYLAKNKTGATLITATKDFQDELSCELLLTIRQKCRIRNAFDNNILGDIKLSKTEFRQIYWSIDENNLVSLATMATTSAIDGAIRRKMQEQEKQSLWSSQIKIYG